MSDTFVPTMTSAESLAAYPSGQKTTATGGAAWRHAQLSVFSLSTAAEAFQMPTAAEPLIVWVVSGQAQTQEREPNGPWVNHLIKPGSLFITAGGEPYEFRWQRLSAEPVEVVMVLLDLALFDAALEEVHGANAVGATLRDVSAVEDAIVVALLQRLREEAQRADASTLLIQGVAQVLCVHLARHYVELPDIVGKAPPSLPMFKLRRITAWMADRLAEEFSLGLLAEQAGMSEYHFNRLFKSAVGMPPSQYQIKLRIEAARRLLRESEMSIVTIANQVGYSNPSHFSRIFRKDTGLSPSEYRRQR